MQPVTEGTPYCIVLLQIIGIKQTAICAVFFVIIIFIIKTQCYIYIYIYIYLFVYYELIEETGQYPKLIFGNFWHSSTSFGF